jgi:uncharacterized protein (TIGR02118 family)
MTHIHYFIVRKPQLAEEEFHRYWRENHAPIVKRISQIRRYVQSHRIPFPNTNAPYDGEAEVWVDGLEALHELRHNPEYLNGALADERNFIEIDRSDWMATEDKVLLDGQAAPNLVKVVFCFRRRAGMPVADFRRHWLEVHGPLALKIPAVKRYVQSHTIDAAYRYAEPRWDAVAQLWFDSVEALGAALGTDEFRALGDDARNFIEGKSVINFVAQEYPIIV